MRYVSHELRSPLNHQTLGLQLLYESLKSDSFNNRQNLAVASALQNRLQDVIELQETCEASLRVLNDILAYDRLIQDEANSGLIQSTTLDLSHASSFVLLSIKDFVSALSKEIKRKVISRSALINIYFQYFLPFHLA